MVFQRLPQLSSSKYVKEAKQFDSITSVIIGFVEYITQLQIFVAVVRVANVMDAYRDSVNNSRLSKSRVLNIQERLYRKNAYFDLPPGASYKFTLKIQIV